VLLAPVCYWRRCATGAGVLLAPVCYWRRCATSAGVLCGGVVARSDAPRGRGEAHLDFK